MPMTTLDGPLDRSPALARDIDESPSSPTQPSTAPSQTRERYNRLRCSAPAMVGEGDQGGRQVYSRGRLQSPRRSVQCPLGSTTLPPSYEVMMGLVEDKRCIMSEAITRRSDGKTRLDVRLWTSLQRQHGQGRDAQTGGAYKDQAHVWNMLKGREANLEAEAALVHYLRPAASDGSTFCMPNARPRVQSRDGFLHNLRRGTSPQRGPRHRPQSTLKFDASADNPAAAAAAASSSSSEEDIPVVVPPRVRNEVRGDPDLVKKARHLQAEARPRSVMLTGEDDINPKP
eukprot:gene24775-10416_t